MHPHITIATIVSEPFAENTYVLHRPSRSDCLVVDPGFEPDRVLAYVERKGLAPAVILNTHGHSDHIAGNAAVKERWPDAPLVIGRRDAPKLTDPELNLSAPFGLPLVSPPADQLLDDGQRWSCAGLDFDVYEISGHSIGHIVLVAREEQPPLVIAGDVLFAGSIGRTDFPDGDFDALRDGIHRRLFTLADDALVLPGHGPTTTIGQEKRLNPWVGGPAGYFA
jgi:hydroxyacylglutathione hydrolase